MACTAGWREFREPRSLRKVLKSWGCKAHERSRQVPGDHRADDRPGGCVDLGRGGQRLVGSLAWGYSLRQGKFQFPFPARNLLAIERGADSDSVAVQEIINQLGGPSTY